MLPLLDVNAQHAEIADELRDALLRVLGHGQFVGGAEVDAFEAAFAAFCGAEHCVGVANGTVALSLVLRAAGIGSGDEVVTTATTFVATAAAIVEVGATPVLVDPELETGLIAPAAASAAIGPRTAALLPVHLWGQTVDLDGFRELADRHGLFLLEDAAQAQGAAWNGRRAGSVGDAAGFSFYPGKNLGALGEAGAVTVRDASLAERIRRLSDHGRLDKYLHGEVGTNGRLDAIQAAALAVKLGRLEDWNRRRREHAARYDAALAGVAGAIPIVARDSAVPVYHQYVVRVADREAAAAELARREIGYGVHYPIPLHRQPALAGRCREAGPLAAAEELAATVLSLPIDPTMTAAARERVVAAVRAAAGSIPVAA